MKLYVARFDHGYELGMNLNYWDKEFGWDSENLYAELDDKQCLAMGIPPLEIGEYTVIEFEKPSIVARVDGEGPITIHVNEKDLKEHLRKRCTPPVLPYDEKDVLWKRKRWDGVTTVCLLTGKRYQWDIEGKLL